MTFSSFFLILRRQFSNKWGRFLLASGGIMVGVWAITLTASLSLGLSDTIVKAINSQSFAKEISVSKTESNQSSFFDIKEAPKFVPISLGELEDLSNKYEEIVDFAPDILLNLFVQLPENKAQIKCVEQDLQNQAAKIQTLQTETSQSAVRRSILQETAPSTSSVIPQEEFEKKCLNISISATPFQDLQESRKSKWLGKTEKTERGEIVTCFKCGNSNFGEKLGFLNPEALLNQEITVELQRAPEFYEAGKTIDVANFDRQNTSIKKSELIKLKIVAVIDDREDNSFGLSPFYLDLSYYKDAFKLAKPEADLQKYGAVQNTVFINDYNNLDAVIEKLRQDKLLVFSAAQLVIGSIKSAFAVLTVVLALFGLIALIASVFGIVNVMTISVLERQKEIGILKSLGARNGDIFWIFLVESAFLGFLGWLLGILLSLFFGFLISFGSGQFIANNSDLKNNLSSLNISSFSPEFPWWLLTSTLVLALFFTIISGIFPALKAARQNPVDVLRSE